MRARNRGVWNVAATFRLRFSTINPRLAQPEGCGYQLRLVDSVQTFSLGLHGFTPLRVAQVGDFQNQFHLFQGKLGLLHLHVNRRQKKPALVVVRLFGEFPLAELDGFHKLALQRLDTGEFVIRRVARALAAVAVKETPNSFAAR